MAQLIKLEDYISRYQKDIYHYPGQFIRLKKENWNKLLHSWQNQHEQKVEQETFDTSREFPKWKKLFKREYRDEENNQDGTNFNNEEDMKRYYLDTLFPMQLKWASTTVKEMSFLDRDYYSNFTLKYFLQRFPDTYLLLYHPTFQVKNSVLEGDIILVSPIGIEIIKVLEMESSIIIIPNNDRTWYIDDNNIVKNTLSPMVSLKRTEKIVKSILNKYQIDFPVNKVVLSRTNTIKFDSVPFHTKYIGKDQHDQWLKEKRQLVSPLKHVQLKVCEVLLKHCYTSSLKRPEWEDDSEFDFTR